MWMRRVTVVLVGVVAAACAARIVSIPVPPLSADDVGLSVFLIGDAGAAAADGDPVLQELTRAASVAGSDSAVVFLGDNLYPSGLPARRHKDRATMERRLHAQIEVASPSGARAFFVPGNHDWERAGMDGWGSVQRAEDFIRVRGRGRARQEPSNGCPGPSIVDLGDAVRLVFLDTQWWLHTDAKPVGPHSGCRAGTEAEVVEALTRDLESAGPRHVIVAAHHPLATRGAHGGYFPLSAHLFPLRAFKEWLWVPLPIVGSLYPLARMAGITSQDLAGSDNERMRRAIGRALSVRPPLLFAAGHEHTLQVFRGPFARYTVVSGSGIDDHQTPVGRSASHLYASARPGFMRVDVSRQGRVRLAVIEVDAGRAREAAAFDLTAR
jgi:hypothetical protein